MNQRSGLSTRWLEALSMLAVVAGFVQVAAFFVSHGYLPAPFVFDVGDTFMDWFNTAAYAHNPGAYDVWGSVYPPLSFVFLKLFGDGACYHTAAKDARDCDVLGIATIVSLYGLSVLTAGLAFYKADRTTAVFRGVAYALSLPLLYALERGNVIMAAFVMFNLLFGGLLMSRKAIATAAALLINLKTYLLLPVLIFGMRREWRMLELCGFATVLLYLLTLAVMGSGTPIELQDNIATWLRVMGSTVWDQDFYTTTYAPYLKFDPAFYPARFLGERTIDLAKTMIVVELVASKALALLCLLCGWLYPRVIAERRLVLFILMQSFLMQSPGGYGVALILFLVFLEPWKNAATGLAIVLGYVSCIAADPVLATLGTVTRASWLSGHDVQYDYVITLGMVLRPGLLVAILWALAIDSLIDVARARKAQRPLLWLADRSALPA